MADPANLDPNVLPYIPRTDGDLIRADEWNDIQRSARQDIQKHRHTGDAGNPDDGVPVGADGLEDGAVTADKIEADAVTREKIRDQAVNEVKLEDDAVTQTKIKGGSDSIRCNFPVLTDIRILEEFSKFTSNGNDFAPDIASDSAGNLHVVWSGRDSNNLPTIWYAKIDKNGNFLTAPVSKLDSASGNNFNPKIAGDLDGNLQVFWVGRDAGANNRRAIFYAKLGENGNIMIAPQIKIRAAPNTNASGAPNGNTDPDAVIDPDGNIQLIWVGNNQNSTQTIYYAKLNKNGGLIVSPVSKLSAGQFNFSPIGTIDADGNFNVFWNGNGITFHAQLDLGGIINISPAILSFLSRITNNTLMDAMLTGDGNILLAAFSFVVGANFPKMDPAANLISSIFPLYPFRVESLAQDVDGKFHVVFVTAGSIAYAKLDIEKPPVQNASLTDLLTTLKIDNFGA
jgi:hypothetical protein